MIHYGINGIYIKLIWWKYKNKWLKEFHFWGCVSQLIFGLNLLCSYDEWSLSFERTPHIFFSFHINLDLASMTSTTNIKTNINKIHRNKFLCDFCFKWWYRVKKNIFKSLFFLFTNEMKCKDCLFFLFCLSWLVLCVCNRLIQIRWI